MTMRRNDLILFDFRMADPDAEVLIEPDVVGGLAYHLNEIFGQLLPKIGHDDFEQKVLLAGVTAGSIRLGFIPRFLNQHAGTIDAADKLMSVGHKLGLLLLGVGVFVGVFEPNKLDAETQALLEAQRAEVSQLVAANGHLLSEFEHLARTCANSRADIVDVSFQGISASVVSMSKRDVRRIGSRAERWKLPPMPYEGQVAEISPKAFSFQRVGAPGDHVLNLYMAKAFVNGAWVDVLMEWKSKRSIEQTSQTDPAIVTGEIEPIPTDRFVSLGMIDPRLYDAAAFLTVSKVHIAE